MLQDIPIPTPALREASSCVLETERLTLRRPTLADVKAIAHLANDRRIAENTRRLPHPYLQDHAVEFVRATSTDSSETVFLIEQNHSPVGMVGIDRSDARRAGTRLLARRRALGPRLWHRSRARGDRFLLRGIDAEHLIAGARVANPASRNILEKCGFQWSGVEAAPLRGAGILDPGRPLPPGARRLVVAEELGEFDAERAVALLPAP
jgi:RimJ/RimL family protein N-acetyltransferase